MKSTQASRPHKKPSKKSPTSSEGEAALEMLHQATELLRPLMDFHQLVDSATDDDLRIFWDVRIVRGGDTQFAQTTGVSTLPRALAPKMKALAPAKIQEEVTSKILQPLIGKTQQEVERLTFEQLEAREAGPNDEMPEPPFR